MYKAAIFDLDGTIADTIESIAIAANKTLTASGLKPLDTERYKYFAGDGADTLIRRTLAAAGDTEGVHFEQAYAIYKEFFEKDCTYKVKVFEGMKEVLDRLKTEKVSLAVLSNKPHDRTVTVVETLFGKEYFDFILGQQASYKRKPDPEGAYLVAKQLQVSPSECIYVGDTNVDMQTGTSAGMYTVGVLWGFREREELEANHADAIIAEPKELLSFFF